MNRFPAVFGHRELRSSIDITFLRTFLNITYPETADKSTENVHSFHLVRPVQYVVCSFKIHVVRLVLAIVLDNGIDAGKDHRIVSQLSHFPKSVRDYGYL